MKKIVIAIDGHSSCGKSTVAKQLARKLNYIYIDSGAMYRCVTLFALENKLIINDKVNITDLLKRLNEISITFKFDAREQKNVTLLNGVNVENKIRGLEISNYVSEISTIKEVRQQMVKLQQDMGKEKRIIMDGRDIGTVVFPEAELKIFMTATPEVRARRRYDELVAKGERVNFQDVLDNVIKRDQIDSTRTESPLRMADDAILLDNSSLTRDEQLNFLIQLTNKIIL